MDCRARFLLVILALERIDPMILMRLLRAGVLGAGLAILVMPAMADSVQLANGDVLNGRVLSLDDKQLRLESEVLGQVTIPRGKIRAITLGDHRPAAAASSPAGKLPGAEASPEAALKRLKTTGVNPKDLKELQQMLPLLATPEASKYFNDTVKGLMSGTRSIGDLRKEAMRARDELKKATRGLGPDVEAAIAPYMQILDSFIRETQPPAPKAQNAEKQAPALKK
jgi:hypothetical protein